MRGLRLILLSQMLVACSVCAQPSSAVRDDGSAASREDVEVTDVVLVIGEQPGPALWKVRSGDRTLWILGTVTSIPGAVDWRSKQLERVLAGSQEVLLAGGLIGWGPKTKQERAALKRASLLPPGSRLNDVVPPNLYPRAEAARRAFVRQSEDFERQRPFFASMSLVGGSLKTLRLKPGSAGDTVIGLAKRQQIPVTYVQGMTEDFDRLLKNFEDSSMLPCLEETVVMLDAEGAGL